MTKPRKPPKQPPAHLSRGRDVQAPSSGPSRRARTAGAAAGAGRSTRSAPGGGVSSPAASAPLPLKIDRPGIFDGVAHERYLRQLCAGLEMQASNAIDLIGDDGCPRKAWHGSHLNPKRGDDDTSRSLFGTAAHTLLLEGEEAFAQRCAVEPLFPRNKEGYAAKARWKRGLKPGVILLNPDEGAKIRAMVAAVRAHPWLGPRIVGGQKEQTIVWRCRYTGVWCKSRPDVLNLGRLAVIDYKTMPSAHPIAGEAHSWRQGYHLQAAWVREGLAELGNDHPQLISVLAAQETDAPFVVEPLELDRRLLDIGHELNIRARFHWVACHKRGDWPGYRSAQAPDRDEPIPIGVPVWAARQFEERRELPRLATDVADLDLLRKWMEWQAPLKIVGQT